MQNGWLRINQAVQNFQQILNISDESAHLEEDGNENENENENEKGLNEITDKQGCEKGSLMSVQKGTINNQLYDEIINSIILFRKFLKNKKVQIFLDEYNMNCFNFNETMILLEFIKMNKYMLFMLSKILNINLVDSYGQFYMNKEEYDMNISNLFISILKADKIFEINSKNDEDFECHDNVYRDSNVQINRNNKNNRNNINVDVDNKELEKNYNNNEDKTNVEKRINNFDLFMQKEQSEKINECEQKLQKEELQKEELEKKLTTPIPVPIPISIEQIELIKKEKNINLNKKNEKMIVNEIKTEHIENDFVLPAEKHINIKSIIDFINEENKIKIDILNEKIKYLQKDITEKKKELQDFETMKKDIEKYKSELNEKKKKINDSMENIYMLEEEINLVKSQLNKSIKENEEYMKLKEYCKNNHIDKKVIIEIIKKNQDNFKNSNIQNEVFLLLCDMLGIKSVVLGLKEKKISEQFLDFLDKETKD